MNIGKSTTTLFSVAGIGALGAASVMVLGGAGAQAAANDMGYNCKIPILGNKIFKVSLDTDAPASAAVGSKIAHLNVKVVSDPAALKTGYTFGAREYEGTTTVHVAVGGVDHSVVITTPRSAIASDGSVPPTDVTVPLNAPLSKAGSIDVVAGKIDIRQKIYNAQGNPFAMQPTADIPCTPPASGALVDRIVVGGGQPPTPAKVATSTVLKAKAGKKSIKVKVAVAKAPTGKVKLVVKGPRKLTKTLTLKKGAASVVLKKLKKGKYKLRATYAGSSRTLSSSSRLVVVKVTK